MGELRDTAALFAQVFLLPARTSPALADRSLSSVPSLELLPPVTGEGTVPPEPARSLAAGFVYCKPHKKPWGKQKRYLQPLGKQVRKTQLLSGCCCPAEPRASPRTQLWRRDAPGPRAEHQPSTYPGDTSMELTLVRDICEPPKGSSSQPRAANPTATLPAHSSSLGTGWGTRTEGPGTSLLPQESQDPSHTDTPLSPHLRWLIAGFPPTVHLDPSLNTPQHPLVFSLGFALITSSVDPQC